ncbi:hypothetical protein TruAng_008952 [Truncatella angustata]|nr:hypothetical protein TruAng_008952 [Truncatella angustata]
MKRTESSLTHRPLTPLAGCYTQSQVAPKMPALETPGQLCFDFYKPTAPSSAQRDPAQDMASQHKANDLPKVERYITDHNAQGKAIFSDEIPAALPTQTILNGVVFGLGYATTERPVVLDGQKDIKAYKPLIENPPGIVIPGGTVARYVDTPPESISPMHRTVSIDYGVVVEGEVELILDSGEKRLLKRGDLAVQRGTMHAWRNPSKTEWNRMLYFLQESGPVYHEGKKLDEDYGEMGDEVRKSGN